MDDSTALFKEIGARIGDRKCKKSFNLLYKSIDKVDVRDFHAKCDHKGPTVTLLYGKFNTIFGGYTSQSWESIKTTMKKDDKAFLFYKHDNKQAKCIFFPIKKDEVKRAITCNENFGPTFGGGMVAGYDLQAFKKDKTKPESETEDGYLYLNGKINIGSAYERNGITHKRSGYLHQNEYNEQSYNFDTTQYETVDSETKNINSGKMIVKRIEIYHVVDAELPHQWRNEPTVEECGNMRKELEQMQPLAGLNIKQYNILLIGMIGSGKSSFYNTLSSVFSGKVIPHAPARNSATSVTNEVHSYDICPNKGEPLKIRIFDIRGFEDERGYDQELELLLDGKLKIGYRFPDKLQPVKQEDLKQATINDEIHLICFVTGISNFQMITGRLRARTESVKHSVAKKGLPMAVVATKFDEMCPFISEDARFLYRSPRAESSVRKISEYLGIDLRYIFPVVNYVQEQPINQAKDSLALQALHGMMKLTEAYLQKHRTLTKNIDDWEEREKQIMFKNTNEKEIALMKLHGKLTELMDRKLRVLVIGPTHSGKSSFIDSISSALRDEIVMRAVGGRMAAEEHKDFSMTEKFQMYQLKYKRESGDLSNSNVYFGDTPGLQIKQGITVNDIKLIVQGHVPNKYEIIKGVNETSAGYRAHPSRDQKMHVVCFVFYYAEIESLADKLKEETSDIMDFLLKEGIPFVVILTKGDVKYEAVKRCKLRVFGEKEIKKSKDLAVKTFSIKESIIFPVINYCHEREVNLEGDALLFAAFNEIVKRGLNYFDDNESDEEEGLEQE